MKKLINILLIVTGVYLMTLTQSCEKEYVVPQPSVDSTKVISFSLEIIPIFNESCNGSGCHNTGGIAPDLSEANAYSDIFIYNLVDTTDVMNSALYTRMIDAGNAMPPTGILPNTKTDLVKFWIQQGAKDN